MIAKFARLTTLPLVLALAACSDSDVAAWNSALAGMNSQMASNNSYASNSYASSGGFSTPRYYGNGVGNSRPTRSEPRYVRTIPGVPAARSTSSRGASSSSSASSSSGGSSGGGLRLTACARGVATNGDERVSWNARCGASAAEVNAKRQAAQDRVDSAARARRDQRAERDAQLRVMEAERAARIAENARLRAAAPSCPNGGCVIPQ